MIPTQPFGKTGHDSTRIIFGAAALWGATRGGGASAALELLLDARHQPHRHGRGVRALGAARRARGCRASRQVLPGDEDRRAHVREGARPDPPLARAAADGPRRPDPAAQPRRRGRSGRRRSAPGGALEAAIEAREQGLTRFIGVTGHGVTVAAMHLRSLERFAFDSVLLPYNYVMMQQPAVRRRLRGAGAGVRRARRRDADDQGHHARAVEREGAHARHVVRAADASRRTSTSPCTTCWAGRACS